MKNELRMEMKKKLTLLSEENFIKFSKTIKNKLLASKEWKMAKTIGITVSIGREVNTRPIIEAGWSEQKRIVIPKCYPDQKLLKFYHISSYDETESQYFSLVEPDPTKTTYIPKEEIDLLIVPGVLFDLRGFRIGYGGGYYDRYLKDYNGNTISLAFSLQVMEDLPIEQHDIQIQKIITEAVWRN